MASTDLSIKIKVEDSQKAVTDLAAVDAGIDKAAASAQKGAAAFGQLGKFTSTSHAGRLADIFKETGVSVNTASRHVEELSARMQRVARERAFQQLAGDARLSALQIARLRASMGDTRGALSSLASAAGSAKLAIAAWGVALLYAGKACLDAQIQMQRLEQSYKAVFGAGAGAQLQAVYEQTSRVGLKFVETAEAAKSFFAAGQGTGLAPQLGGIFRAVTNAGAALQLSTDDINGTFIALGQMMSKGKVQAEELRGQLGERLPGAFRMAAKAMGMTTAELDKFMADGKLTAEDLLPKLAEALEEKYARAAEAAADTAQGAINRMSTEWTLFKANVMDSGPMVSAINAVTAALEGRNRASGEAAERRALENQLAGMGIGPDLENVTYDSWGGATRAKSYSGKLLNWMRNQNAAANEEVRIAEERAREQENAIAKGRAALDKAVKGTAQAKIAALREERAQAETEINAMIEVYKNQGQGTADLEAEKSAALAAFDAKIAAAGKKGASAARSAAVAQADYVGELERTRAQIHSLQQQLALDEGEDVARARIRIEQQYQAELAKTSEELQTRVTRGSLSREQADMLRAEKDKAAELQKQVSLRDAEAKASEKAVRLAEGQLSFYKELNSVGGRYEDHLELQVRLIEEQAKKYTELHLPPDLVTEWERLQRLQASRAGWDGLERGARKFGAEYGDMAAQVEGFTTQMGTTISDTLADAFMKGKLSAADFFNSLIGYAAQAASNALIGQIFSGIGGLFGGSGAFGGDVFSGAASATTGWVAGFATGGVAEPSGLPRSGGVLNSPTFFNDGMSRAYARGGLSVAGEAGPEVFMPATRMSDGNYGVRVDMSAVSAQLRAGLSGTAAPNISINVINQTGGQVDAETQARPDGNGGFTLDVLLTQVEQGLVSRAKNGRSSLMQYQEKTYGLSRANVLARGRGRA